MINREIKNARIVDADITNGEYGCLTVWIRLDYGGSMQGFGGYSLGNTNIEKFTEEGGNYAGWFINRCLQIAGVEKWSQIKGKTIRVESDSGKVHAIGHIIDDDWFNPKVDFEVN